MFGDDVAAVFRAALEGPAADGKAAKRRMAAQAAQAYEAAHARRAAELGGQQFRPGQVFACALDMLGLGDDG